MSHETASVRTRASVISGASLLVALAALVIAVLAFQHKPHSQPGTSSGVVLPDVIGLAQPEATSRLAAIGLQSRAESRRDVNVPNGVVLSQVPLAGRKLPKGGTVTIFVSTGPP
jgi:serine/threonine-protein kinase